MLQLKNLRKKKRVDLEEFVPYGWILKHRGLQGELNGKVHSSSTILREQPSVVKVRIEGLLVPFFVDQFAEKGNGQFSISFDDYNSIEKSEILIKKELYLPGNILEMEEETVNELIGFNVVEKNGNIIGQISNVIENGPQQLLVLKGNNGEIMIPLVEEYVVGVDPDEKRLIMDLPEGLIDL